MNNWLKSSAILKNNEKWIPGGVVSLNRKCEPTYLLPKAKEATYEILRIMNAYYSDFSAAF
ncbi:MAG TPA: hypothetical protein VFI29_12005 [Hanamia sp.]|nr:hypothetical protein [Hanamia sp.]